MPHQTVIEVENLRKTYGPVIAVETVSLEVYKGEIFGLVGPNGAGKTTTIECLEGLRRPDAGEFRVLGLDPGRDGYALRERIGVQLQERLCRTGSGSGRPWTSSPRSNARPSPGSRSSSSSGWPRSANVAVRQALGRAEAAPLHRPGPGQRPGARLPRRAHDRPRSAGPPRHVGPRPRRPRPAARPSS